MNNEIVTTLKILGLDQVTQLFNQLATAGARSMEVLATAGEKVAPALTAVGTAIERVQAQFAGLRTAANQAATRMQADFQRVIQVLRDLGGVLSTVLGFLSRFAAGFGLLGGLFSGGLLVGMTKFVESTNLAVESLGDLAEQIDETLKDTGTLVSVFAEAGVGSESLENTFRRLARTVERTWDEIVKATRDGANAQQQAFLQVQQAALQAAQTQDALRTTNRDMALEERSNALAVVSARLAVNEAYTNYRAAIRGAEDELVKLDRIDQQTGRAGLGIQQARLALQQAINKQLDDRATRQQRAEQAAIQAELAQLNVLEARRKAAEQQANDLTRIAEFVKRTVAGVETASLKVNDSVENIVKGIITVAGVGVEGLDEIKNSFESVGTLTPKLVPVIETLADVLKNTEGSGRRMAITMQFLGRAVSQDLVAFLAQGSEAVRKHRAELEQMGVVYTEQDAKVADAFKRAKAALTDTVGILINRLGVAFGPAATKLIESFRKAIVDNFDTIIARFQDLGKRALAFTQALANIVTGTNVFDFVRQQMEEAAQSGEALDNPFVEQVVEWQVSLNELLASVQQFWADVTALFSGKGASVSQIVDQVFDKVVAAVGAKLAKIPAEGEKAMAELPSVLGRIAFNAAADFGEKIVQVLTTLPGTIFNAMADVGGIILGAVQSVLEQINVLIQGVINGVVGLFTQLGELIRLGFELALTFIREQFTAFIEFVRTSIGQLGGIVAGITQLLTAPFRAAAQQIIQIWQSVIDFIKRTATSIGSFFSNFGRAASQLPSAPSGGLGTESGGEFAGGGQVDGPGTTTSDSILAWLSKKEWVINARAVQRLMRKYGGGVMHMINRGVLPATALTLPTLSRGGFAAAFAGAAHAPRFATGGAVRASPVAVTSSATSRRERNLGTLTLKTDRGETIGTVLATEQTVDRIHRHSIMNVLSSGGRKQTSYRG